MSRNTIRLIVLMGTISIIGIIVMQIYWVQKAFDLKEKTFNQTINIALKNVADNIARFNHSPLPSENPVNELSSDYYVVNVNTVIDASVLEHYLKKAFLSVNMNLDYEYAIYDCSTNKMMYGKYVSPLKHEEKNDPAPNLPVYNKYTYYFGIHFPTKSTLLAGKMGIWIFSSAILLIVITFFGYALYIILKQSRLSEIQKDFVNNMTHEFKTPLSTISVSTDVLSNREIVNTPETLFNYVNIIKQENSRLIGQVEKVLQMANIDSNSSVKLHREKIALHGVLESAISKMRVSSKNKEVRINYTFNATNDAIIADKVHVSNIIYNLLDNAIKYSPQVADIEVKTENSGKNIIVSVSDKGIGIDKTDQRKVFHKFYRVPTGNVHDVKGFGLGLHYVKNIVRAHHWKIYLASEPGTGSTFTFKIPIINA
jgi:two-component system, OmpR family, phosphate regulon sensor histidine kinase PhoR